jgi:hypothetical protein
VEPEKIREALAATKDYLHNTNRITQQDDEKKR